MIILSIDPGPEESAWVVYEGDHVIASAKVPNCDVMKDTLNSWGANLCLIEQVACMGMAVGAEVFETVFWSGRFAERFGFDRVHRIKRHEVKMHLCGNMRANDSNIRQAIIDKYGGKAHAIGRKALPGPLYGVKGDCWAALAIAITFTERNPTPV